MGNVMVPATELSGVKVQPLKQLPDERGVVKHMLRSDSPLFTQFGEIYFSYTKPFVIKAWKCHQLITQNLAVPQGELLLVLVDTREDSPTKGKMAELVIGDNNYCLVQIPPRLIYGFQPIAESGALIANCIDQPFQPEESITFPLHSSNISYQWKNSGN